MKATHWQNSSFVPASSRKLELSQNLVTVVAASGDAVPGTGGAVLRSVDGSPAINNPGQVTFMGTLEGQGVTKADQSVVLTWQSGVQSLVARQGDMAPGTDNQTFLGFNVPGLTDSGQSQFFSCTTPEINGGWCSSGSVALMARSGQPAPGVPGATFKNTFPDMPTFDYPFSVNREDVAAFCSPLNNAPRGQDSGLWAGSAGNQSLILLAGQAAPGTRGVFSTLGDVRLNDAGQMVIAGTFSGGANGIWTGAGSKVEALALAGDNAPGTSGTFLLFSLPTLNNTGQTALWSQIIEGSRPKLGIWAGKPGSLKLIALSGQNAPGAPDKATFVSFDNPVIDGSGRIAFLASYSDPAVNKIGSGIWVFKDGALKAVAITGQKNPATGLVYDALLTPMINAQGNIAIFSFLQGGGSCIWAGVNSDLIVPVARTGYLFPIKGGGRTVSFCQMNGNTGNQDGQPRTLAEDGTLAFKLDFSDKSSAMVTVDLSGLKP